MPHLFRVIVPVRDINRAADFYGALLGEAGQRVSPGRHYFDCEGTILACYDPEADGDGRTATALAEPLYIAVDDLASTYRASPDCRCHLLAGSGPGRWPSWRDRHETVGRALVLSHRPVRQSALCRGEEFRLHRRDGWLSRGASRSTSAPRLACIRVVEQPLRTEPREHGTASGAIPELQGRYLRARTVAAAEAGHSTARNATGWWVGSSFNPGCRILVMGWEERITVNPAVRSRKPCIKGTRIAVYDILEYLAGGMTEDQILGDFPDLQREDIRASLAFAAARERRVSNSVA